MAMMATVVVVASVGGTPVRSPHAATRRLAGRVCHPCAAKAVARATRVARRAAAAGRWKGGYVVRKGAIYNRVVTVMTVPRRGKLGCKYMRVARNLCYQVEGFV